MRRTVRSLLPTIAVLLASLQAARAGATGLEASALSTPAHHRGANGPDRAASLALPSTRPVAQTAGGVALLATAGAAVSRGGERSRPAASAVHRRSPQWRQLRAAALRRAGHSSATAIRTSTGAQGRQVQVRTSIPPVVPAFSLAGRAAINARTPDAALSFRYMRGAPRPRAPCGFDRGV